MCSLPASSSLRPACPYHSHSRSHLPRLLLATPLLLPLLPNHRPSCTALHCTALHHLRRLLSPLPSPQFIATTSTSSFRSSPTVHFISSLFTLLLSLLQITSAHDGLQEHVGSIHSGRMFPLQNRYDTALLVILSLMHVQYILSAFTLHSISFSPLLSSILLLTRDYKATALHFSLVHYTLHSPLLCSSLLRLSTIQTSFIYAC